MVIILNKKVKMDNITTLMELISRRKSNIEIENFKWNKKSKNKANLQIRNLANSIQKVDLLFHFLSLINLILMMHNLKILNK